MLSHAFSELEPRRRKVVAMTQREGTSGRPCLCAVVGYRRPVTHHDVDAFKTRFDLHLVEFLVTTELAGQRGDQVPVLFGKIPSPPPQLVGNPNITPPTVWRPARRQHQAVARNIPHVTVPARGKLESGQLASGVMPAQLYPPRKLQECPKESLGRQGRSDVGPCKARRPADGGGERPMSCAPIMKPGMPSHKWSTRGDYKGEMRHGCWSYDLRRKC
jgi:hypothetical protein